ncbi:hypothetical protein GRF29_44g38403 [Pseudopithomyces chartarum]|uniref:Major facilitator superfamily (MFS) profile domain-containing protein n=1 Tax=Pseudopithomyces chartarum TaxID=1892770 RepID=A0AAN6RI47_9PLEO|nr:hypothetical protein GRF29_44g38403 [Pseudopithomyces chartarum]
MTTASGLNLSNGQTENKLTMESPPEGGWLACMAALACFLVIMNTWGMIISFGIFQTYYVSTLHQARSDIAWVGSIAVFLLFFMGIISGRLTDAGYLRITTISGAVLVTLGTFMTSLTDEYWQVVLSQGLCTGLGNGLLLTPMMTLITMYFRRRLPIVMGIVSCGSVTGGFVARLLPCVFASLSVGGVQALFIAVVPIINSDSSKMGARMGFILASVGVGALIGSPISGAIIASNKGSYAGAQTFSGSALFVGGLAVLAAREVKRRQDRKEFWDKI